MNVPGAVTMRKALVADAAGIAHVHIASWRTTYRGIVPDAFLDAMDEEGRTVRWQELLANGLGVWLAEADGITVGFISGGAIREPVADFDAELQAIYLLHDFQGRGVGSKLLATLARDLAGNGHRKMVVWALRANDAVSFYERMGAHFVSEKQYEIGGAMLPIVAYGWDDVERLSGAVSSE